MVAFHESGHAVVGWLLEHTEAVMKVRHVRVRRRVWGLGRPEPKGSPDRASLRSTVRFCLKRKHSVR